MIDLTTGIVLSSTAIEEAVAAEPPTFISTKDQKVEYGPQFPNMMFSLWGFIIEKRNFPIQSQFVTHYMKQHSELLKDFDEKGVKARLLRTYPSLAREIHFYSLTKESGYFDSVSYSAYKDVHEGIDLQVEQAGRIYNVACFVDTHRGNSFRRRKASRHKMPANAIEMPLALNTGKHVGDWIFFTDQHVFELLIKIADYATNHFNIPVLETLVG